MLPSKRILFRFLLPSLFFVAAAIFLTRFLFEREAVEIRLRARDWNEINFRTVADAERSTNPPTLSVFTQAGAIYGEIQYISSHITGVGGEDYLPQGTAQISAEEVEITLIDVSKWNWFVDFNQESESYYFSLWNENGSKFLDYIPPFAEVPSMLAESVTYHSSQPEQVVIAPADWVSNNAIERTTNHLPGFQIVANEPAPFGIELRAACNYKLNRSFNSISQQKNTLFVLQKCDESRPVFSPAELDFDSNAKMRYSVFATPLGQSSLLIAPTYVSVEINGSQIIENTSQNYLVLIQDPGGVVSLDIKPQDLDFLFRLHTITTEYNVDEPAIIIEPAAKEVTIQGAAGKLATGIDIVDTDELSEMSIQFEDWPTFFWENNITIDEVGEPLVQQYLSGLGVGARAILNGKDVITRRWDQLAEEIQGAFVAALLGAAGWIILKLLRNEEESQPINIDLPPPNITLKPVLETNHFSRLMMLFLFFFMGGVLVGIAWLGKKMREFSN